MRRGHIYREEGLQPYPEPAPIHQGVAGKSADVTFHESIQHEAPFNSGLSHEWHEWRIGDSLLVPGIHPRPTVFQELVGVMGGGGE